MLITVFIVLAVVVLIYVAASQTKLREIPPEEWSDPEAYNAGVFDAIVREDRAPPDIRARPSYEAGKSHTRQRRGA